MIKIAASPLSAIIKCIYNQSIGTGIVPDVLKVSQVSSAYKGGDATDPSPSPNPRWCYRSLLSPFSRLL